MRSTEGVDSAHGWCGQGHGNAGIENEAEDNCAGRESRRMPATTHRLRGAKSMEGVVLSTSMRPGHALQLIEAQETVLQPPGRRALAHIPGDNGWPVIGHTLQILADPKGFVENRAARYGLIFRSDILGETCVYLLGPEANELALLDPQQLFSSRFGWTGLLDRVFPGGLIMMDFDEHRLHRRALSVAFKAGPLRSWLHLTADADTAISARIATWRATPSPLPILSRR